MRPDACAAFDPHPCGSNEAYVAGCRLDGCRLMQLIHTKNAPTSRRANAIDAEPYAVVIRALLRQGHTLRELAVFVGYSTPTLRNIALGVTTSVYADTAKALTTLVELLPSERVELRRA